MKHLSPPLNAIRSSTGLTWIDENGIVVAVANAHDVHTLNDAQENVRVITQLVEDTPKPLLIDMSKVKSMSRDARMFYAGPEPPKVITAVAMVTNSNIGKLVANFFISLTTQSLPTKMFTEFDAAKQWLMQFKAPVTNGQD
jgi:hypothetical protein